MIFPAYLRQVELLLRVLPHAMSRPEFSLKGGTAINLFIRDMPRLSVDIDLVYLPVRDRETSLAGIHGALADVQRKVTRLVPGARVLPKTNSDGRLTSLIVRTPAAQIKVEPNLVIRGTVYPTIEKTVRPSVLRELRLDLPVRARLVSLPDLFGGKICAALDRQHPRDLFDVMHLLNGEGVTLRIRKAFLVYLISHDRPMSELLAPRPKDIRRLFQGEFQGMTVAPISLPALLKAREKLVSLLQKGLTDRERRFLITFKEGEPDWALLDVPGAETLPAPQWKLLNVRKMSAEKRGQALAKLKVALGIKP